MSVKLLSTMCVVFALSIGVATATAGGGNSSNAKTCQKGGWATFTRSDGTSFANEGACVSYASRGGTLTPKSQSQLDCESFGGTFVPRPQSETPWLCNGWIARTSDEYAVRNSVLQTDCMATNFRTSPGARPFTYDTLCSSAGA